MPAWRLDETERQVNKYDVGASDGEELHFVGHVFLCDLDEPTQVDSSTAVIPAFHMGPPLQQSPCEVDAVGSAALDTHGLSARESRQIKSFVDD